MSFVSEMEGIIQVNGERGLEVLLYYHGLDLELFRQTKRDDPYGNVHGKNAGNPVKSIGCFRGAIADNGFFDNSLTQSGAFKTAMLYTDNKDIKPGDEVAVVRKDGRRVAYRVEHNPSLGQTTEVFTKYELSGIM